MAISDTVLTTSQVIPSDVGEGDVSVALHGSLAEGDLVLAMGVGDATFGIATAESNGWTEFWNSGNQAPRIRLLTKIMGATPDTAVDIAADDNFAVCVVTAAFRGTHPNPLFLVDDFEVDEGTTGMPNAPLATATVPWTMSVFLGGLDDDDATSVALSGADGIVSINSGESSSTAILAWKKNTTAGDYDPAAFTGSGETDDAWHAGHLILRPQAAGVFAHHQRQLWGW